MGTPRKRTSRTARSWALGTVLAASLAFGQDATSAEPFELAFCAPVGAWPMSSRERPGFDNVIARILAEEMGAEATFVWTQFDEFGIRDTLHSGLCDVAVGISETVENTLHSVPYLKTPFVFVTRTDRGIDIASLDDPRLRDVVIGTYQTGIPSVALRNRDIVDNVREFSAIVRPTGVDGHTPILDAVLDGRVDVGIVYGPVAAARAADADGALTIVPVTPEVDFGAAILQLSRVWTIAVRPYDTALRDRINRVLATRWDDVHAAIDAYGVPQLPLSRPTGGPRELGTLLVGAIVPAATPAGLANAPTGEDARRGFAVAENSVATAAAGSRPFVLLEAHAPTSASIERAALRLIRTEGVHALIGGYDNDEARLLARIATEHGVPFLNVGAEADDLRDAVCFPTTLHVTPSLTSLVRGMVRASPAPEGQRLFVVAERGLASDAALASLERSWRDAGGASVDVASVEPGQFVYYPIVEEARAASADVVMLLMNSEGQEALLGQAGTLDADVVVSGLATVRGQSRTFLQRFLQVAPERGGAGRVVVWDPALPVELNETFAARTAEPMEPAAWTTYAAILVAFDAARAGVLDDPDALRTYLTDPDTLLDVGKERPVRFRVGDGEMIQELYVSEAIPGASWGRTASQRSSIALVASTLNPDAIFDTAGDEAGGCAGR